MFLIIQIPFVDLRIIQKNEITQYFFPNKFMSRTGKKIYYRHFGSKCFRQHTDGLPQSEYCYFNSKKILKLNNTNSTYKLVFARLFAEDFFFHFDIGLKISNNLKQKDLCILIKSLLNENIFIIPNLNKKEIKKDITFCSLNSIQQYIESLYIYATSFISNNINDYKKLKKDTINLSFGNPTIFCQYNYGDYLVNDSHLVTNFDCIDLHKTTLNNNLYIVQVWFAGKKNNLGDTKDILRNLRICLLKLHNYREGLISILQFLDNQNRNDDIYCDILRIKFKYLIKLLKRSSYYGMPGKHIMDIALQTEMNIHYENWEDILDRLEYYYNYFNEIKRRRDNIMNVHYDGDIHNSKIYNIEGGNNVENVSNITSTSPISDLFITFDNEFEKLLIELNPTYIDIKKLKDFKEDFTKEATIGKRDRIKLSDILKNIKSVFSGLLTNSDKLSNLYNLGKQIIDSLS